LSTLQSKTSACEQTAQNQVLQVVANTGLAASSSGMSLKLALGRATLARVLAAFHSPLAVFGRRLMSSRLGKSA
jgi:hypothetical protein